jgi:hypothetical protein
MVSVILAASDQARQKAIVLGFREEKVLIRWEHGISGEDRKVKFEGEIIREIKPYQFLVADFWGAGPE